jgi:RNA polymerase sigma-70 factor (ECF subfamily)
VSEPVSKEFTREIRVARMRFLKSIDPLRPELYRFCRSLARNVWDAEDLLQDTLLKAFAKLAEVHWDMQNPRAYLFRIATNLWIDRFRKSTESEMPEHYDIPADDAPPPGETREAIRELARLLGPRERAGVLLKDVFDFTLEETAAYLQTTVGATKALLHRAREKVKKARDGSRGQPDQSTRDINAPNAALLDRWCDAFNKRDLPALTALMLEDATAEVVGMVQEYGRNQARDGSIAHTAVEEGAPMAERREYLGEPIVVLWYTVQQDGRDERVVRDVLRFTQEGDNLLSLRFYYFCPETLAEVCAALNLPLLDNGYRYS